jgi:hypothetical protein
MVPDKVRKCPKDASNEAKTLNWRSPELKLVACIGFLELLKAYTPGTFR